MRELILEFSNIVDQNHSFVIISHNKPDGDTLGANLALSMALKKQGKHVISACYDDLPDYGKFLQGAKHSLKILYLRISML